MQYKVLNLRGWSPYGMFYFNFLDGSVFGQFQFSFHIFLLQDGRFTIGNDLILHCPYVKDFIDFNTKSGFCSAFVVP